MTKIHTPVISPDPNSVGQSKNAMQIVNKDIASKTTGLESTSNDLIVSSKYQIKNETRFLSSITNTTNNVTSISNAAARGSTAVTGDFNGEDVEVGAACTTNLPIAGVTASGNDGNEPQNILDNNLGTRWSCLGICQFITVVSQ
jgi:hypothetical protein